MYDRKSRIELGVHERFSATAYRLVCERQLKSVMVLIYAIAMHDVFALHAQRTRLELACD